MASGENKVSKGKKPIIEPFFGPGEDVPRQPGDADFYAMPSGYTHVVTGMSNDITGTPPEPSMRGNGNPVGTGLLGQGKERVRDNGVLRSFFQEEK